MHAGVSNLLAGEFFGGEVWSNMVCQKQATLRPSMRVFSIGVRGGKYFGGEILMEIYDKTNGNVIIF